MSGYEHGFGPCDCGEVDVWPGNAEITADDDGVRWRHSRHGCRRVALPIPGPPPLSAVEPPRGPWCDDCAFYVAETPRARCREADWAGWVDDPRRPPCGGSARLSALRAALKDEP